MSTPIALGAQILVGTASVAAGTTAQITIPRQGARTQTLESWVTSDGANNKYLEVLVRDLKWFPDLLGHIDGTNIASNTTFRHENGVAQPNTIGTRGSGIYAGLQFIRFEMSKYASGVDNTDIAGVNRTLTDVALVPHIDWVNAWALGATAKTLEVYGLHSSGSPSPFGIDVNAAGNQQLCVQESELGGMTSLMGYGTPHFRTENVPHFGATYLVTALTDAAADIELRCGYHYEAMI